MCGWQKWLGTLGKMLNFPFCCSCEVLSDYVTWHWDGRQACNHCEIADIVYFAFNVYFLSRGFWFWWLLRLLLCLFHWNELFCVLLSSKNRGTGCVAGCGCLAVCRDLCQRWGGMGKDSNALWLVGLFESIKELSWSSCLGEAGNSSYLCVNRFGAVNFFIFLWSAAD